MDLLTPAVDGFIAGENEFLHEFDAHMGFENDPHGFGEEDGVAEGSRSRVDHVFIGWVSDDVDFAVFSAGGVVTESLNAFGELLAVIGPIGVASPAFIDTIIGDAWTRVFIP